MTYTGQALKRFEDPRLVTGMGVFVDDVKLPGMLYASFLRSPHAHARIRAIDASEARSMPGVVAVLIGEDTYRQGLGTPTCATSPAKPRTGRRGRSWSPRSHSEPL